MKKNNQERKCTECAGQEISRESEVGVNKVDEPVGSSDWLAPGLEGDDEFPMPPNLKMSPVVFRNDITSSFEISYPDGPPSGKGLLIVPFADFQLLVDSLIVGGLDNHNLSLSRLETLIFSSSWGACANSSASVASSRQEIEKHNAKLRRKSAPFRKCKRSK